MTANTDPGNVDATGHFSWHAVTGATDYLVRLYNDTKDAELFVWTTQLETTAGALVDDQHYGDLWHISIAAIDNNGVTMTQAIAVDMDTNNLLHYGSELEYTSPLAPITTTTTTSTTTTSTTTVAPTTTTTTTTTTSTTVTS